MASAPYAPPKAGRPALQQTIAPKAKKGQPIERRGTTAGSPGKAVSAANRWRENYNPLRGLRMTLAVSLLESGQRGDMALLQWTYRFVEMTYPTLCAVISRCEAPLLTFDWEIKIKEELPEGATEEQAEKQQATLKEAYERIDNLKDAIQHLHLAEFRGYAHLQKHRDGKGEVYHLEPLDQWCVCRDGLYGDWFWNPDSRQTTMPALTLGEENRIGGEELPIEDFMIREVARPIDRIALINFLRSNLCEKDWDGFIEIYGIPGGVVVMPANIPAGKEAEYENAAQRVAEGGSGAVPAGSDYKANDGPRGVDPFTPRISHLDEQVILVATGGKLTMLAESGSGTLAGGAHSDTFEEIADGRAQKISERFQRDFDREVLERKHPGEPALVYFKFGVADVDSKETAMFKRDVLKVFASNPLLCRVLANQIDLKETIRGAGLPLNEEYTEPYVPVADDSGATISGELAKDAEGDVIGAAVQGGTPDEKKETKPGEAEDGGAHASAAAGGDVQATALNGAQVTALAALATEVATGQLPLDAAKALAVAAFPLVPAALIDAIFKPLANFKPEPPPAAPQQAGPETQPDKKIVNRDGDAPPSKLEQTGGELVAKALAADLQPVFDRLGAILQISDGAILEARLKDFLSDFPQLTRDLTADPKCARALYQTMSVAMANGLANGPQEGKQS